MLAEPVVNKIKGHVSSMVKQLKSKYGITPKLVAVMISNDPASRKYVELKTADCAEVGIISEVINLSGYAKEEMPQKVAKTIRELNDDPTVNAILPQMPFDDVISPETVFSQLSPEKDADGLTSYNLGRLSRKEYTLDDSLIPCTPKGIILLAKHYGVPIEGSEVAIINRSPLVGTPLWKLFLDLHATPTCYHTKSPRLRERVKEADIIVAAVGRHPKIYGDKGFQLTGDMVKKGSAVFSVGQQQDPENPKKMLFDVDEESLEGKCAFLTPNKGGVGPMTRACLLENTLIATLHQKKMGAI